MSDFSDLTAPSTTSINIHEALTEVRGMEAFQPPKENPIEAFLKQLGLDPHVRGFREEWDRFNDFLKDLFRNLFEASGISSQDAHTISTFLSLLLVILIVVLLLLTLFALIRKRLLQTRHRQNDSPHPREIEDALAPAHTYLEQARQSITRGIYDHAIRAIYLGILSYMDATHLALFRKERTNLDYLRELRKKSRLSETDPLASHGLKPKADPTADPKKVQLVFLTIAGHFERVFFGNQSMTPTEVERCFQQLSETLEQQVPMELPKEESAS